MKTLKLSFRSSVLGPMGLVAIFLAAGTAQAVPSTSQPSDLKAHEKLILEELRRVKGSSSLGIAEAQKPKFSLKDTDKDLYREILASYKIRNYIRVSAATEELLKRYPKSQFGDNALFLRGRLEYFDNRPGHAIKSFAELEKRYPYSSKRPAALLAKAMVYRKLNLNESALHVFRKVAKNYPGSQEGRRAQIELRMMRQ